MLGPEVPATAFRVDGQVMSFWTYLEPTDGWPPDEATVGAMLRDLHGVLLTYPTRLPTLPPLYDVGAFLDRPESRLGAADAAAVGLADGGQFPVGRPSRAATPSGSARPTIHSS
jgi:hypothetical protein